MALNDDILELIEKTREESESNRFRNSDEYEKLFDKVNAKSLQIDNIETQIGCPLDIAHSVQPGKVVCVLFPNKRMYRCIVDRVSYFGFTLSGEPDFTDFIYFNQYKQTWWLKEDKSE